jgi:hypothetical protein
MKWRYGDDASVKKIGGDIPLPVLVGAAIIDAMERGSETQMRQARDWLRDPSISYADIGLTEQDFRVAYGVAGSNGAMAYLRRSHKGDSASFEALVAQSEALLRDAGSIDHGEAGTDAKGRAIADKIRAAVVKYTDLESFRKLKDDLAHVMRKLDR